MEIVLWIIGVLFSIWLVACPLVCLYWVFRPAEWLWWKRKFISKIIGFGAFFGCVLIITQGVIVFLWFIPDCLLWKPPGSFFDAEEREVRPVKISVAGSIGFFGTFALWTALEKACNEKRRREREARISLEISYKNRDLQEGKTTIAELRKKIQELEKLQDEDKLGPLREERLIALEQVLEVWGKPKDSLSYGNELTSRIKEEPACKAWASLHEAYSLLLDAVLFDKHQKRPLSTRELLSNVRKFCGDRRLSGDTETVELIWDVCRALEEADTVYEGSVKDVPGCLNGTQVDPALYAEKQLPSEAGNKMWPYLEKAGGYLNNLDMLLSVNREGLGKLLGFREIDFPD